MRVLLCGYHEAGYRALRLLAAGGHELLVGTHDGPPELPSVAALARSYGVRAAVDDAVALNAYATEFAPDLIISMYYRHILPQSLLSLARIGAINFHPSLLPRHRGCFSAPWAIIEGDRETGVTCHHMTPRVDAGDIVDSTSLAIRDDETGISLYYRLVDAAVLLLERVLHLLRSGELQSKPQTGTPTHHSRKAPYDGLIDRSWTRPQVDRFVRAMFFPPYPPAALLLDGVRHDVRSLAEFDALIEQKGRQTRGATSTPRNSIMDPIPPSQNPSLTQPVNF